LVRNTNLETLCQVLDDWDPLSPASYVDVRARLMVTFDTASRDYLFGSGGLDWFWSNDQLDVLDRDSARPPNPEQKAAIGFFVARCAP
jgi:hypothetical protein